MRLGMRFTGAEVLWLVMAAVSNLGTLRVLSETLHEARARYLKDERDRRRLTELEVAEIDRRTREGAAREAGDPSPSGA